MTERRAVASATAALRALPGNSDGVVVATAPGRVNLIGDHVDYNDGLVLPCAINRHVVAALRPLPGNVLRAHAPAYRETREIALSDCLPSTLQGGTGRDAWFAYVAGVAGALMQDGHSLPGMEVVVAGDVPIGRGLSSSAALELAVARAMTHAAGVSLEPVRIARVCQRAEREFVGLACGVMDQLASAASIPGHALLIDCRTLEIDPVRLPDSAAVVVIDTGVARALTESAYNARRATCERALLTLQVAGVHVEALRDLDDRRCPGWERVLHPEDTPFVRHVVDEIARPPQMAEALRLADLPRAGRLMAASHASLRDLYRVSCDELDLACAIASAQPGCFGARMTGAGFGGCAVALVDRTAINRFIATVETEYRARSGRDGSVFGIEAVGGARVQPA